MHTTKRHILESFKKNNLQSQSTSALAFAVYPAQMNTIQKILDDPLISRDKKKQALLQKAKYHRKLLHHLNGLTKNNILKISSVLGKGEKLFSPQVGTHEELIVGSSQRISLKPSTTPSTPIEGYEGEQIIHKFEPLTWTDRANAIMLNPERFNSLEQLYDVTTLLFSHINDVIAYNDFEKIIQEHSLSECTLLIEKLAKDCIDYDKRICLIVDATNIINDVAIEQFFTLLTKMNKSNIVCVFDITAKELVVHRTLFENIAYLFAKHNLKFNLKNDDIHKSPYIVGKAGPYTIDILDWRRFIKKGIHNTAGICIGQSSVVIDLRKFFEKHKRAKTLSQVLMNIAKSLFIANSLQRKNLEDYFRHVFANPLFNGREFFSYAICPIRFVNYKHPSTILEKKELIELLQSVSTQIQRFAYNQEVIYLSCGMPMRFKVAFSQAYKRFTDMTLFDEYDKLLIRSGSDLYAKDIRQELQDEEILERIFAGGHEVRLYREGIVTPQEAIGECAMILHTYKFAFFCYKFELADTNTVTLEDFAHE